MVPREGLIDTRAGQPTELLWEIHNDGSEALGSAQNPVAGHQLQRGLFTFKQVVHVKELTSQAASSMKYIEIWAGHIDIESNRPIR